VPGAKDSTHLRVFSADINFSRHKAYARFVKGQHERWLKPLEPVPMEITIMDPLDRTGRGGDHKAFSDRGLTAVRFTSANENGNGGSNGRQHTVNDVLGDDRNGDGILDTLYVNFGYLARNACINAVGLVGAALGPQAPDFSIMENAQHRVRVTVIIPTSTTGTYKVAVRTTGNDFSAVHTLRDSLVFWLPNTKGGTTYYVAVSAVDGTEAQSLYALEKAVTPAGDGPVTRVAGYPARRTPLRFSQITGGDRLAWVLEGGTPGMVVTLSFREVRGRLLIAHSLVLTGSRQEIALSRDRLPGGVYEVSLESAGKPLARHRLGL
jgi:hypothetical protein